MKTKDFEKFAMQQMIVNVSILAIILACSTAVIALLKTPL